MTHDEEITHPDRLHAVSHRYTATQFCFVPHPDGRLSAFYSYGTARTYIATMTDEEVLDLIRKDYAKQKQIAENRKAHERAIASAESQRERSLSDIDLSDIKINFSL